MKRHTLNFLLFSSILPIVLAVLIASPTELFNGIIAIIQTQDILITDYIAIGGLGASLLNVGMISLLAVWIIQYSGAEINGTAIASVYLMGSFAFFGKNIFNVLPILLGTYLYSKITKERYCDIVHISLLATSFAPIVTELLFYILAPLSMRLSLSMIVGISAGFIIKPVSRHLFKVHEGFNLYNTGFSIGILATLYVSIMKSYGYEPVKRLILDTGNTLPYALSLSVLLLAMFMYGFYLDGFSFKNYRQLLKEPGYLDHDYLKMYGLSTVLINMAINGFIVMGYVLFIAKAGLNGPYIGAILTVVGFSGLGKHARNIWPILVGVVLGSLTQNWTLDTPTIVFAALFGTALAPIAGHFGWGWGILASYINSSVALNSGQMHAGMNLYNTGFSVGIVAAVLVPIMHRFAPVPPDLDKQLEYDLDA